MRRLAAPARALQRAGEFCAGLPLNTPLEIGSRVRGHAPRNTARGACEAWRRMSACGGVGEGATRAGTLSSRCRHDLGARRSGWSIRAPTQNRSSPPLWRDRAQAWPGGGAADAETPSIPGRRAISRTLGKGDAGSRMVPLARKRNVAARVQGPGRWCQVNGDG